MCHNIFLFFHISFSSIESYCSLCFSAKSIKHAIKYDNDFFMQFFFGYFWNIFDLKLMTAFIILKLQYRQILYDFFFFHKENHFFNNIVCVWLKTHVFYITRRDEKKNLWLAESLTLFFLLNLLFHIFFQNFLFF